MKWYKVQSLPSILLIAVLLMSGLHHSSQAQNLKTLASNTFNGAMTGGIVGGATMALQNSQDFAPVRFGVGLGTLGGLAIGAHDVAQAGEGQQYIVEGTFNTGHATTVIILLDSIYGGATGALVGMAVNLMANEPLINGIQYGSGAGIWGGFLFGMVDAFYLSSKRTQPIAGLQPQNYNATERWLTIADDHTRFSFLQPELYSFKRLESNNIKRESGISLSLVEFAVQL